MPANAPSSPTPEASQPKAAAPAPNSPNTDGASATLKSNGLAIVGLVLSFLFFPAGLVVSIIALAKSKEHPGSKGLAIAGIVISIGALVAYIAVPYLILVADRNPIDNAEHAAQTSKDSPATIKARDDAKSLLKTIITEALPQEKIEKEDFAKNYCGTNDLKNISTHYMIDVQLSSGKTVAVALQALNKAVLAHGFYGSYIDSGGSWKNTDDQTIDLVAIDPSPTNPNTVFGLSITSVCAKPG